MELAARLNAGFPWRSLLAVTLIALGGRALLLASGAVSFHGDEAVVALMARHINDGARPAFFYGQAYMGSLDAYLVALGFRLLGESVLTIRIVQAALYTLVVALSFVAGWRFSRSTRVAALAALLLAIPTANVALYTTATLGGYNETLLLGTLLLILGHDLARRPAGAPWRWLALGVAAGRGWWTNGLIVAHALPLALLFIIAFIARPLRAEGRIRIPAGAALAVIGLGIGAAPWWLYDVQTGGAALATFLRSQQTGPFEGIGVPYVPPGQRALGLLLLGLPALIGMRFPWSGAYFAPAVGLIVAAVMTLAWMRLVRGTRSLDAEARLLFGAMPPLFALIFVASTFGADPTGRYFLPLALPLALAIAALAADLAAGGRRMLALALVALIVGYQGTGVIVAAATPPGLTTQFDPISHIANDHDAELIAFLEAHGLERGYTSYFIAYRLAFLSAERVQYRAALPYKADLSYNTADERYAPYTAAADAAAGVGYITANHPALDTLLRDHFAAAGVAYSEVQIGPFTVFYDFDPPHPRPPTRFDAP